jgi:hypothetical protein
MTFRQDGTVHQLIADQVQYRIQWVSASRNRRINPVLSSQMLRQKTDAAQCPPTLFGANLFGHLRILNAGQGFVNQRQDSYDKRCLHQQTGNDGYGQGLLHL